MSPIIVADIGGTHARFALASIAAGRVTALGPETVLRTADHTSLESAWAAFGAGQPLPRAAAIAVACPVPKDMWGDTLKFTNNPWIIRPADLAESLNLHSHILINDFEAVSHAVAQSPDDGFDQLCGPDTPLSATGVITIVGPGTGTGVGQVLRTGKDDPGGYHVIASEGGHVDFAPVDAIEDAVLASLRRSHGRVSAERIVSGPGLAAIHATLAAIDGTAIVPRDDKALWTAALDGSDPLAAAALERFCMALGSFAGNTALSQGAAGVVIAGGLGLRLAKHLPQSGFTERFVAKGRFQSLMAAMPVKIITHPQPGLFGAAAAFARKFAA